MNTVSPNSPITNKVYNEQMIDAAKLYPELTPEQQEEAAFYLTRYLEVVERIFRRTHHLTDSSRPDRIRMD
jgi:hypothetical protein